MAESYYLEQNKKKHKELLARLKELPAFCRDYFISIEPRTSSLTRVNYATDLYIFFDYLSKNSSRFMGKQLNEWTTDDLNAVNAKDIERFLSYLSFYELNGKEYINGENAKARKLSAIRSLFKYFYHNGELKENVASKVKSPKLHDKAITRLDGQEINKLLNNAESETKFSSSRQNKYSLKTRDRDIALLTLLLGTGIRVSECVGLNIDDVDLNTKSFVVTRKGGNKATLYFSDEVKDALGIYIVEKNKKKEIGNGALFLSLQNKRITVRAVENLVKKYAETVTTLKKITPHKLRSTYGTALYRETKDIYVVAEVLGHRDVNTTKRHYAAISEDIKKQASSKVVLREDK